jgi:hypothetical protein
VMELIEGEEILEEMSEEERYSEFQIQKLF